MGRAGLELRAEGRVAGGRTAGVEGGPHRQKLRRGRHDSPYMVYRKERKLEASYSQSPVTGRPRASTAERGPGEAYLRLV